MKRWTVTCKFFGVCFRNVTLLKCIYIAIEWKKHILKNTSQLERLSHKITHQNLRGLRHITLPKLKST